MGRFLTRDTWLGIANSPMSFNKWNYGEANPVNRIDPFGLFAKEVIAENMHLFDFSEPSSSQKKHSHWGLYALLRNAIDGDWIKVGYVDLLTDPSKVSWASPEPIFLLNCKTIMIGSQTLRQYYDNVINQQWGGALWWRDTTITDYELHTASDVHTRLTPLFKFTDGSDNNTTTYPDFKGASIGLAVIELNILTDIDGNPYLGISGGYGGIVGFAYTEGYLSISNGGELSPTEFEQAMSGFCLVGIEGIYFGGINISNICHGFNSEQSWSSVTTYYMGLEVGYGIGSSAVIPLSSFGGKRDPKKGWRWALDKQHNGVTLTDVMMLDGLSIP